MRKSGFPGLTHFYHAEREDTTMEHDTQFLETEPVGRLMHRYAIPCDISLLVGAHYNI